MDHLATTLGAWRRAPRQPPPPSKEAKADAVGALARVSTIKASASYIERQVAEAMREEQLQAAKEEAAKAAVDAPGAAAQPVVRTFWRRWMLHPSNLCVCVPTRPPRTHLSCRSAEVLNIPLTNQLLNHHTPQQELCRCATKKRGEPLEAYVRRISTLMLEEVDEDEEGQAEGGKAMEAAAAGRVPTLVPMDHEGRPMSPKELAAGLLEASKDVDV